MMFQCNTCGCGKNYLVHQPARNCEHCAAPSEHHDYVPGKIEQLLLDAVAEYDKIPESASALDSLDLLTHIVERAREILAGNKEADDIKATEAGPVLPGKDCG